MQYRPLERQRLAVRYRVSSADQPLRARTASARGRSSRRPTRSRTAACLRGARVEWRCALLDVLCPGASYQVGAAFRFPGSRCVSVLGFSDFRARHFSSKFLV